MLAAGGDSVVEVSVGLLPRLVDPPGRVRLAEEEALRPDPLVRPDASPTVRDLGGVCGGKRSSSNHLFPCLFALIDFQLSGTPQPHK